MNAPIDLDRETRAAVAVVVRQLENRGDADDEPLALAIVTALKGLGWRPTLAKASPDWRSFGTGPGHPDTVPEVIALKQQLAAMEPLPEHRPGAA